ncbi:MAG: phage terminase large subunit [Magnetococcales bacterium]|nr:phage terminase large subunit [Magnetococcales bacterium]
MARTTKKVFLRNLERIAADLRATIEARVSGFDPDPKAQHERRALAEKDFKFFAQAYFPHYTQYAPSVLHNYLFESLPELTADLKGRRLAVAAPRGEAKSTTVSLIYVLWCVLTERRRYVCLIMDAFEQAVSMLEAIRAELEVNPRLAMDFSTATGIGNVWKEGVIVTKNRVKIQAFGSGKRMRGLRHGPHRPDLVILDDIENDENVRSPEQRNKLDSWLDRTVLSLGSADDTMDAIFIGTVLHYDSVLSRKLTRPLWSARTFRAILEWPARMDLWDKWEEILLNTGEAAADAFFAERQSEMERGAVVSWPAARPIESLMKKRARDGHQAFDSEQQNDPLNHQDAPFNVIRFWVDRNPDWVLFGSLDPSLGRSDPAAILVGGYDRKTGILDVVEAIISRMLPDRIIEEVIRLQRQHCCRSWAVETVQFQEFLKTELVKRSAARGVPVPARAVKPHANKEMRIESLQPHMANGLIRIHSSQRTLFEQLRHWPMADHDDGPDALEMLWAEAIRGGRGHGGGFIPVRSPAKAARHSEDDDDDGFFSGFGRIWR